MIELTNNNMINDISNKCKDLYIMKNSWSTINEIYSSMILAVNALVKLWYTILGYLSNRILGLLKKQLKVFYFILKKVMLWFYFN